MPFITYKQHDAMDCGPTCLRMIARYYGKDINIGKLREYAHINRNGVSLKGIADAAEKIGFKTLSAKTSFQKLVEDAPLPCVLHWDQNHFVVLPPQNFNPNSKRDKITVADPATGLVRLDKQDFLQHWLNGNEEGIVMLFEKTPAFDDIEEEKNNRLSWATLWFYVKQHRKYFLQIFLGLLISSLLQLIFPFLTQSIVDVGINTHNLSFIYLILIAQFSLSFFKTVIEFIRSRLLLFVSTRVNLSLLTGFWSKLMKLPMSYFDTKLTGDIQQRILDQHQIEKFLTGSSLSTLFSLINLLIFSIVLYYYSPVIFAIFITGSVLYLLWVRLFLYYRRDLNYKRFSIAAKENSATMQLIHGMQEIKLNNSEQQFRWDWEHIQANLFRLSFKNLSLNQYQQAGAVFINETKNIFITFFAAKLVLEGHLSLGTMLAIQYIIGQLNSPIEQMIGFTQSYQDAKIALERLNEIHEVEDEEPASVSFNSSLPENKSITLNRLSFAYPGMESRPVLKNISLHIPENKVTAIVGMSGSGKTTLLKLLLKFYANYGGEINIGENNLKFISPSYWRSQCGNVMQDGYIFNDTIARNIAVGEEVHDNKRILHACKLANLSPFIDALPLGLNTKIGMEGNGISQGQRQRILIARAVYKNPEYLFFDEATNALDASNEKKILENLEKFFQGRTVVVVAHRLSTVKGADKIVVLHQGEIVEEGTHEELTVQRGYYFELVKNQLELGS